MSKTEIKHVLDCVVCGKDHTMIFLLMPQPEEINGKNFSHWGVCPNTARDILYMNFVEENDD